MLRREAAIPAAVTRRPWLVLPHSPAFVVWSLFLLLIPVYILANGLPQPSDALIVLLVPMVLAGWDGRLDREHARIFRALLWFTLWVFLVNYGWAAVLGRWGRLKDFVIHPFFYLFN